LFGGLGLGAWSVIERVRIVRFKRFADHTFDLSGQTILLAGQNNSGKTTLLQAISAWNLALRRWLADRKEGRKNRISVVLDEFTALPLREMNLLWLNRHTARLTAEKRMPRPAPVFVEVTATPGARVAESLTMEFQYANEKLVYVRPVIGPERPEIQQQIPDFVKALNVVHVPPFSGIGTQEQRYTPGIQNKYIGEGKPGEIVRNLLLDICPASAGGTDSARETPAWNDLKADILRLFQYELLQPQFSDAQPYILCEYRPPARPDERSSRRPKFDIANAGSGFHQVLLLLSFFYARPSSVMLLDEPDAHLHFILQGEIFDHLRSVAQRRNCKLIIATHAEKLLADTEPEQIISFVGAMPRRLVAPGEKRRLQDALKRLTALDLVQADHVQAVLYVEDESDFKILREWAEILDHPARSFLRFPYVVSLLGKGNLDQAKQHFQCLTLARPELQGACVIDRDSATGELADAVPRGLRLVRWPRYEIENYLLVPALVKRLFQSAEDLFTRQIAERDARMVDEEFARNFPAGIDYLSDLPALRDLKASDFLVELLAKTSQPLPKRDLFMLAKLANRDEIHPDVRHVLDAIASIMPATMPSEEANAVPSDLNGVGDESPNDEA
jgi:hypothetical protein